jgi:hypothetical protein
MRVARARWQKKPERSTRGADKERVGEPVRVGAVSLPFGLASMRVGHRYKKREPEPPFRAVPPPSRLGISIIAQVNGGVNKQNTTLTRAHMFCSVSLCLGVLGIVWYNGAGMRKMPRRVAASFRRRKVVYTVFLSVVQYNKVVKGCQQSGLAARFDSQLLT